MRTASPARSRRASRRSPGWPFCTSRRRPCGLTADSRVRMTMWRRGLAMNRFSGSVPPTISALTALTSLYVANPGRAPAGAGNGCAWAVYLRRGSMPPLCAIRGLFTNGFTGPIPASITALTRLVTLCAPPPPVRGLPAEWRVLNGYAAAQEPQQEPLLRQRAADNLRADRSRVPVRPESQPGYRQFGACVAARVCGCV